MARNRGHAAYVAATRPHSLRPAGDVGGLTRRLAARQGRIVVAARWKTRRSVDAYRCSSQIEVSRRGQTLLLASTRNPFCACEHKPLRIAGLEKRRARES